MLIVFKQDNALPQQWKLGRIVEIHPGKDDITRVVTIRTNSGEYRRLTKQIAVLPISDNEIYYQERTTALAKLKGGGCYCKN